MTREATNTMQEELLQELSRQEEAESKVASVAQENARVRRGEGGRDGRGDRRGRKRWGARGEKK